MQWPRVIAVDPTGNRIVAVGIVKKSRLTIGQVVSPRGIVSPPRYVDSIVRQSNGYSWWKQVSRAFDVQKEVLIRSPGYDEAFKRMPVEIRKGIIARLKPLPNPDESS